MERHQQAGDAPSDLRLVQETARGAGSLQSHSAYDFPPSSSGALHESVGEEDGNWQAMPFVLNAILGVPCWDA